LLWDVLSCYRVSGFCFPFRAATLRGLGALARR
jgi:hypothetical protein